MVLNRADIFDWVYDQSEISNYMARYNYHAMMADWDVVDISCGSEYKGVLLIKGHEVHMQADKRLAVKKSRLILNSYFRPLLENRKYLTSTTFENSVETLFVERLGFYETCKKDGFVFYRLDQLKIR